jgi:heat shock protein HtpX
MKRIALFVGTNIAVLALLAVVMFVFRVDAFTADRGINYTGLLIISAVVGFGGSFISLAISRWVAKWTMGIKVIQPGREESEMERWLLQTTHQLSRKAGLKGMPEVGIYDSPEVNAFATGPSQKKSLVAVSTALMHSMDRNEVEGVLAHEVAHIQNGDMVTMTLVQGVINTFVIFLSRIIGYAVSMFVREEMATIVYFVVSLLMQVLLGLLGTMIVMAFSRRREFVADAGAATLSSRENMIAALRRLQQTYEPVDHRAPALQTMKISGAGAFMKLFSSHPPLEERIAVLQNSK